MTRFTDNSPILGQPIRKTASITDGRVRISVYLEIHIPIKASWTICGKNSSRMPASFHLPYVCPPYQGISGSRRQGNRVRKRQSEISRLAELARNDWGKRSLDIYEVAKANQINFYALVPRALNQCELRKDQPKSSRRTLREFTFTADSVWNSM